MYHAIGPFLLSHLQSKEIVPPPSAAVFVQRGNWNLLKIVFLFHNTQFHLISNFENSEYIKI